jgi:hypothetical protein
MVLGSRVGSCGLTQVRDWWWALMNLIMNLQVL